MSISIFRYCALIICLGTAALAQYVSAQSAQPLNDDERDRVLTEMRAYKHDILTKALSLTKEQQREFFPIYDAMDDSLMQIGAETRELERRVNADADASGTELEAAAAAVFSQKQREGNLEMEYFDKFKAVLTPRQMLRLKSAEREFTQRLVRHHRRVQAGRKAARNE